MEYKNLPVTEEVHGYVRQKAFHANTTLGDIVKQWVELDKKKHEKVHKTK